MVWMLGSAVAKEGVNRGEAHVSGRRYTVPLRFKILRTEVAKIQIANRYPSLCGDETQQQDEGVAVSLMNSTDPSAGSGRLALDITMRPSVLLRQAKTQRFRGSSHLWPD